jgi:hypothetical protein
MKIELKEITIREVTAGYVDNAEEGVTGYGARLNIRPKYQREFVYDERKRNAVIETIRKGFPLNVMYWVVGEDGGYEVLDGQQRTISFCQYVEGDFAVLADGHTKAFHNLTNAEREQILNYTLMVYFCEGNDKEKLDWFKIINIAGEKLTEQELRNAVYTGAWLSHAKRLFSKTGCAAYLLAKNYVDGVAIRQEILQTALYWISGGNIEKYMSAHQHDPNANELWTYFRNVIEWVELIFTQCRREMKGIAWGPLYDKYHGEMHDATKLEQEVSALMIDEDVESKKGIYPYVLSRDVRTLSIRKFSPAQKREAYEKQAGICVKCGEQFDLSNMEADHITPWSLGGKTVPANCQMLCKGCNRIKSNT